MLIWSLNVIISYANGDWETTQYVKDDGGFRSHGPNPSGLMPDLFQALQLNPITTPFYRNDVSQVVYRFSALSANGNVSVAGGINSYFITNNLEIISGELADDLDFARELLGNNYIYIFDYDTGGSLVPLFFDSDLIRIGTVYRNYSQQVGTDYRYSAIVQDLSNDVWVVLMDTGGEEGQLLKLDSSYNVAETFPITGGLGDGLLVREFEPIKAIVFDENRFLIIQEDEEAYYLNKTGQLELIGSWSLVPPTSIEVSKPDPLSLFRYEGEIYCLFESTISVGKWNNELARFDNVGELQGISEEDMTDIIGTYYLPEEDKYLTFVRYFDSELDDDIWAKAYLTMPTLELEILEPVYGFDDDMMFFPGPSNNSTGIGYGSNLGQIFRRFYEVYDETIEFTLASSHLRANITKEDLLLQIDEAPFTQLTIASITDDGGSYIIIVQKPAEFSNPTLRLKYVDDENNNYIYVERF